MEGKVPEMSYWYRKRKPKLLLILSNYSSLLKIMCDYLRLARVEKSSVAMKYLQLEQYGLWTGLSQFNNYLLYSLHQNVFRRIYEY